MQFCNPTFNCFVIVSLTRSIQRGSLLNGQVDSLINDSPLRAQQVVPSVHCAPRTGRPCENVRRPEPESSYTGPDTLAHNQPSCCEHGTAVYASSSPNPETLPSLGLFAAKGPCASGCSSTGKRSVRLGIFPDLL